MTEPTRPGKTFTLAMCQVETEQWDCEGNTARTLESLRQAKEQGADFAVCPEGVINGYGITDNPEETVRRTRETAEPLDGPRAGAFKELAAELQLDFVVGFHEQASEGIVHNSAFLFRSDGTTGNVYRKVHCRHFESVWHWGACTPGDEFSVYELDCRGLHVKAGTCICFDRERPESWECLRHQGVEFIACPLATNTVRIQDGVRPVSNEGLTMALAGVHQVFIAVVNHAGRFNGGSFLVDPEGSLVLQMGAEPGVAVLDVPIEWMRKTLRSEQFHWRGYAYTRPEVYRKYLPERIDVVANDYASELYVKNRPG